MPMPPPEALAKMKELIEKGPPVEPTPDKPGMLLQALIAYNGAKQTELGRPAMPEELIGHLAFMLDHRQWEQDNQAWHQLRAMMGQAGGGAGGGLIARPQMRVPPGILKPR